MTIWDPHQSRNVAIQTPLTQLELKDSPVHFIMTADVKQDDFFLCDQERKGYPVTVRES